MTTELVKFDEVKAEIAKYKAINETLVFDYESKEGNKAARSHIAQLRKVKTEIAKIHKVRKAAALAECRAEDGKKNEYTAEVVGMIDFHDEPLKKIEAREEAKIQAEIERQENEKKAEEDRKQKEFEAREAAAAKKEAELNAKEAELKAKEVEADRIEREKKIAVEAAEKARQGAEAKTAAEKAEETRKAEQAAAVERERVADKAHRSAIERELFDQIFLIISGLSINTANDAAKALLDAMVAGGVDNVTINY